MKATQLEQMSVNYQEVQENKNINKQTLERKSKVEPFKFVQFKRREFDDQKRFLVFLRLYFPLSTIF